MKIPGFVKYRLVPRLPLSAVKLIFRHRPVGLVYHIVSDADIPHVKHLYPFKTARMFEDDLRYLRRHFKVVGYQQLLDSLHGKAKLQPGSVIVTFDDGYRECHSVVRPLLKKYDIPCIFFITTDFVDNRRAFYRNKVSWCIDRVELLSDAELARIAADMGEAVRKIPAARREFTEWIRSLQLADENTIDRVGQAIGIDWDRLMSESRPFMTSDETRMLAADGFSIGAHSRAHPLLSKLSPREIADEIVGSCNEVCSLTGQTEAPFAFPFSSAGLDWQALSAIQANRKSVGLFFDSRGIQTGRPNLVDRIWADPPNGATEAGSNLGSVFHQAYQDHLLSDGE